MVRSRHVLLIGGVFWCLAGCGGPMSTNGVQDGPLTPAAVKAAFGSVGIRLFSFAGPPGVKQFLSYDPVVDVEILPSVAEAKAASRPQTVNGEAVSAIGTRNVLVWVDTGAPAPFRKRVFAALTELGREH